MCEYFPSYEMIAGHHNRGAWYEDDMRSVKAEGVAYVMGTFFKHYAVEGAEAAGQQTDTQSKASGAQPVAPNYAAVAGVVCEEAELDKH
jgi:hypothetical protein